MDVEPDASCNAPSPARGEKSLRRLQRASSSGGQRAQRLRLNEDLPEVGLSPNPVHQLICSQILMWPSQITSGKVLFSRLSTSFAAEVG